jgi:hypothetical protein
MAFGQRFSLTAKPGSGASVTDEKSSQPQPPTIAETGETQAPPSYTAVDDQPAPPPGPTPEELNAAFANLRIEAFPNSNFPTVDVALAHLKLLEAFYSLKDEVAYTDGLFGLYDNRAPGTEESVAGNDAAGRKRLETLAQIREKRWALYVARAVDRFEVWWIRVLCAREQGRQPLRQSQMTGVAFKNFPLDGIAQVWTAEMLPPLGK